MSWTLSLYPIRIQTPLSYPGTILQKMASLSTSITNSLKVINPLIPQARPEVVESHHWLHSDGSFHHQRSFLHHLLPVILGRKLILIVRWLEFHRPQRSLQCNDHHLHKQPMAEFYGMKTAVFAFHLLKTTLSNYLHSTHLVNIDIRFFNFRLLFVFLI